MFREVPLTALVSALLHIGKLSHGPVGGRGETARSCLLTLFIAAHCTPQSLHVVYTQCRGGPLPSATRNTYECIKQHFLLIPPFRNILLGETLYSGLDSCTRSAPALGPGSVVLRVLQLWRYGHSSHGQWPGYGRTVLASACVCVFIISTLTGMTGSGAAQAQSSANT